MSNNSLALSLTKSKREQKKPREPRPYNPKEHAKAALGRWLEAPTNPAHWDCLINALVDVELQARLAALSENSELPADERRIHLG